MRHPRPLTAAELHLELEKEQEAVVRMPMLDVHIPEEQVDRLELLLPGRDGHQPRYFAILLPGRLLKDSETTLKKSLLIAVGQSPHARAFRSAGTFSVCGIYSFKYYFKCPT